jgi:hypothetical protein
MASTYTPIAKTTFSGSATSYTFSSIPDTYTDLVLVCSIFNSTAANTYLRFNGDSTGIYSRTRLSGTGSAASSGILSNTNGAYIDAIPNQSPQENIIVQLQSYSNEHVYKTSIARANNAANGVQATVNLWRNTDAINQVAIFAVAGTMTAGTTLTLYGIQAA